MISYTSMHCSNNFSLRFLDIFLFFKEAATGSPISIYKNRKSKRYLRTGCFQIYSKIELQKK